MNDLHAVHLPLGEIRDEKAVHVGKDTSQGNRDAEKDTKHPNPILFHNDSIQTMREMGETRNMEFEGTGQVDDTGKSPPNISKTLIDSTNTSFYQIGHINSYNNENYQEVESGRRAKSEDNDYINRFLGVRLLDSIDKMKIKNDVKEKDERKKFKSSDALSEQSFSRSAVHSEPSSSPKVGKEISNKEPGLIDITATDVNRRRHSPELDTAELEERKLRQTEEKTSNYSKANDGSER